MPSSNSAFSISWSSSVQESLPPATSGRSRSHTSSDADVVEVHVDLLEVRAVVVAKVDAGLLERCLVFQGPPRDLEPDLMGLTVAVLGRNELLDIGHSDAAQPRALF